VENLKELQVQGFLLKNIQSKEKVYRNKKKKIGSNRQRRLEKAVEIDRLKKLSNKNQESK